MKCAPLQSKLKLSSGTVFLDNIDESLLTKEEDTVEFLIFQPFVSYENFKLSLSKKLQVMQSPLDPSCKLTKCYTRKIKG